MIKFYLKNTLLHYCKLYIAFAGALSCTIVNVSAHNSFPISANNSAQSISLSVTTGVITLTGHTFKPKHDTALPIGEFKVGDRLLKDVELVMVRVGDEDLSKVHDNERFEIRGNKLYLLQHSDNEIEESKTYIIRVNLVGVDLEQYPDQYFRILKETEKPTSPIKITNAISPNGDGVNDTWVIPDLSLYGVVQVEVYDRAGNRLFFTKDPNKGWDGKNKNGQVVPGAYFYVVRIDDINQILRGVVTVYKK